MSAKLLPMNNRSVATILAVVTGIGAGYFFGKT